VQLVLQKHGLGAKGPNDPNDPPRVTGRNTRKAQPDFKSIDAFFDLPFELSHPPADKRAGNTKPAQSTPHACPADTLRSEPPCVTSTPAKSKNVRLALAASSPPDSAAPMPAREPTPSSRQAPVPTRDWTAGAKAAVQARQTMLLERLMEQHNPPQPEQRSAASAARAHPYDAEGDDAANERIFQLLRQDHTRFFRRLTVASTIVFAAIGAGIHWREHIVSLPRTTSQVFKDATATFFSSRQQDRPQLTLAKFTPVESAPIEIISTLPPVRSLPTVYGIFALSNGQTIRLEPMNVRLPDTRIALPGLITKPATVVVPHGRLSFIAYQRELITSAPDNAQLRIVARVTRALSLSATRKPVVTSLDDTWAIRSVSVDLTVAPMLESREMVELRPANPEFLLSPGRYLLVFKNQTYDFVVAGRATDKAHCLEKAETQDGEMFTECRKLP
jgi:hypothetical protein